jgi:hypothetical protein
LPTCRAVGMCRVACEHDAPRPVALSYSLVDAKPGSPDHVGPPHLVTRPARVQELLRERNVRLFRRVVDVGALARADLPEPVRVHLSTPKPPNRLPWRLASYTVLESKRTETLCREAFSVQPMAPSSAVGEHTIVGIRTLSWENSDRALVWRVPTLQGTI